MLLSYGEASASALSRAECFEEILAWRCAFPEFPMAVMREADVTRTMSQRRDVKCYNKGKERCHGATTQIPVGSVWRGAVDNYSRRSATAKEHL